MEFIINNYLWFLSGALIILMIIIGYYAEKTNFGKIKFDEQKDDIEKVDIDDLPVIMPTNVDVPINEPNDVISDVFGEQPIYVSEPNNFDISDLSVKTEFPNISVEQNNLNSDVLIEDKEEIVQSDESGKSNVVFSSSRNEDISSNTVNQVDDDIWKF